MYQIPVQREVIKDVNRFREWICGSKAQRNNISSDVCSGGTISSDFRNSVGATSTIYNPSVERTKSSFFIVNADQSVDKGVSGTGLSFLQELRFSLSELLIIPRCTNGEIDVSYFCDTSPKI